MRRLGRCRHCRRYIARDASHCPFCQTRAVHGTLGARGGAVARALYGALAVSVSAGCGPVAAPVQPVPVDAETAPEQVAEPDLDTDQDGLLDGDDACPLDPEDQDGFQDDDGCPDLDNDADGIPDVDDQCPLEVEVINGFEDEDGCPDDDGTRIRPWTKPREVVLFETRSTAITSRARPLLADLARVLDEHPDILLVAVEGHTDHQERSSAKRRQRLSEKRAEAVRDALVELGVDADRLDVVGYGDTRPFEPNDTERGRANNRRVEFTIRRRGSAPRETPQ